MRRGLHWLRRRIAPGALVLLYHRVAELPNDPQLLAVTPQHFAEHLTVLRQEAWTVELRALCEMIEKGKPAHRSVAITFDDGYADNLHYAKPLLAKYQVPATVFVVSGYLGRTQELWWDELDRLLLQAGVLPKQLRLSVDGEIHEWVVDTAARYDDDLYDCQRQWNVELPDDPGPRQRLYRALCVLLRPLPDEARRDVLRQLAAQAGTGSEGRASHRLLSPAEVVTLAEGSLIEVGAHTVTHPVLAKQPLQVQRTEIEQSKAQLETLLGQPVASFSYPYGASSDYTAATVALVREGGFACACANFPGDVWRGTDRFQLPRVLVRDWDGDEFARRLKGWLGG